MSFDGIPITFDELLLSAVSLGLGGAVLVWSVRHGRHLVLPLAAALVIRALVAVAHRLWNVVPQGRSDAVRFERFAWEWSQSGCGRVWEHLHLSGSYVYSYILGELYACTARAPLMAQMLNVVLGVWIVYLIARTTQMVWGRDAAVRIAWVAAVFPALIIYSTVTLREVWVVVGFMSGVYFLVRWVECGRTSCFAMAIAGFLVASLFHGAMFFAVVAVMGVLMVQALGALLRLPRVGSAKRSVVGGALFSVVLGTFAYGGLDQLHLSSVGDLYRLGDDGLGTIEAVGGAGMRGGTAYPEYLMPRGEVDIIWQTVPRMAYLLIGPPPWEVTSPALLIGFLDSLFYILAIVLLWRYRHRWWHRPELRLLFVIGLSLTFVYGWGTSNFGTGLRHRAKFVGLLMIMVAGLLGRRARRAPRAPPERVRRTDSTPVRGKA